MLVLRAKAMACRLEIAELAHRLLSGLVAGHAPGKQLVDSHLEMRARLFVDVIVDDRLRKYQNGRWFAMIQAPCNTASTARA